VEAIFGTKSWSPLPLYASMPPPFKGAAKRRQWGVARLLGLAAPNLALSPPSSHGGSVLVPRLLLGGYFAWINLS
jgi:hypothetical protein